jgi:hypothetical protein
MVVWKRIGTRLPQRDSEKAVEKMAKEQRTDWLLYLFNSIDYKKEEDNGYFHIEWSSTDESI